MEMNKINSLYFTSRETESKAEQQAFTVTRKQEVDFLGNGRQQGDNNG